ncbi:MAG: signal peptidase II [Planctomycetes bacterium]|nr:signal peptidase II [Planctomycetota bacterium]
MVLSFFTSNPKVFLVSKPGNTRRRNWLMLGTAAFCALLDQATKEAAFRLFAPEAAFPLKSAIIEQIVASGQKHALLEELLWIAPRVNPGAAFSLLSGVDHANLILLTASVCFILVLAWLAQTTFRTAPAWAFGILIGGSIGNLLDRVRTGGVLDFIHLGWWPTFNLADAAIVVGVAILILWIFFCAPDEKAEAEAEEPGSSG